MNNKKNEQDSGAWICLNGKAFKITKNNDISESADFKNKMDENDSFTDQIDTLQSYLESVITASNKNALLLNQIVDQQNKYAKEKILSEHFAKVNKLLNLSENENKQEIKRTSTKISKMNSNILKKKSTFEDLEGLEYVLGINSDLWKTVSLKIKESDDLKTRICKLEKENKRFKEKISDMQTFKININDRMVELMNLEKNNKIEMKELIKEQINQKEKEISDTNRNMQLSIDKLKENYNCKIEDLNTKIDNRVDKQSLDTRVESVISLFEQSTQKESQSLNFNSALFSKQDPNYESSQNDPWLSKQLNKQNTKIEELTNKISNLANLGDFFGLEERVEEQVKKMESIINLSENKILTVSSQFEKIQDNVEKLNELKTDFKRYENSFKKHFGILSTDLENLKTSFELLKISCKTCSPNSSIHLIE